MLAQKMNFRQEHAVTRGTICRLALPFVLLAGAAHAGPWPRERGATFISISHEQDRDDNSYTSLYSEYGWSERHTLGFELGHSNAGETNALFWIQRALGDPDGPNRWAVSLGLGAIERDGELMPVGQLFGAYGRGWDSIPYLDRLPGGGWFTVEARLKIAGAMKDEREVEELAAEDASLLNYITAETTAKTDVTLGWHASDAMMLINQLRLEEREDTGFSAKLATSVVRDLSGPAKIELGVILPVSGDGEEALKLGTWLEF